MSGKAQPGDAVKVHTKEEIYVGTLLPRSELLNSRSGKKIIVLKLDNGYNIGIDSSRVSKIEVVTKNKEKKKALVKKTYNKKLNKVLIISCGGTISSRVDYVTGGVYADYSAEDFLDMMPELESVANIDALPLFNKMSEDFIPEDWASIAKAVHDKYSEYDGFVVTQGTDTLHYTSSATSFFLNNLGKPVIFTAAQRSIDRGSSDAFMNLFCAVNAAANADLSGVFVCMHGTQNDDFCYLHKGTKVRKMHSLRRDAFRSINDVPVGKINYPDFNISNSSSVLKSSIEIKHSETVKPRNKEPHKISLSDTFQDNIALIYFYPGMDPDIFDYYLGKKCRGFVIAGTALGHVSMNGKKSLRSSLIKLKEKKIPVVMTTQCLYGRVDPLVYSPLRTLSIETGVIFCEDMLPETAYVKLGWVLGKTKKIQDVREEMLTNYAGEINLKHMPDCFLN